MGRGRNRVSYLKKPFAKRSFMAITLTVAGLSLSAISLRMSIKTQGQAALNAGAFGFCGFILSLSGLIYGIRGCLEKDKNYILTRISMVVNAIVLIFWVCMITIGLRG